MKIGLIYQPCGLGDILFLQKLAHHIKDQGQRWAHRQYARRYHVVIYHNCQGGFPEWRDDGTTMA
jgi:hypothetical protein